MITFRRSGGMPPGCDEWLQIEPDGRFRMRRTDAMAVVGTFGGALDEAVRQRLHDRAGDCADRPGADRPGADGPDGAGSAGPPGGPPPAVVPDSVVERVEASGHAESLGVYDEPVGPCAALVTELRALLDSLTDQPVAAIALEVDPPRARLVHRGREQLQLEPGDLAATVVHWAADGSVLAQSQVAVPATSQLVGPGWELGLLEDLPTPAPGEWLQVDVSLSFAVGAARSRGVVHHMLEA